MIQDIAPHVYHNEYKPIPPTADSFILSFEDKKILFHQAGPETEISFLLFGNWKESFLLFMRVIFTCFL